MSALKDATEGKAAVLVLNDKIASNAVLHRFDVPTLQRYAEISSSDETLRQLRKIANNPPTRAFLKPTHTSESLGVRMLKREDFEEGNLASLATEIEQLLLINPSSFESWALRHVNHGVVIEELYDSDVETVLACGGEEKITDFPLEVKVQTIFGRFLIGAVSGPGAEVGQYGIKWNKYSDGNLCPRGGWYGIGKLRTARSRLYRSQILQVNTKCSLESS